MTIKVWRNEFGDVMVQGIPTGYWVFVFFGVIIMLGGLLGTFAGGGIASFFVSTFGLLILLLGKVYGNSKRKKKVQQFVKQGY